VEPVRIERALVGQILYRLQRPPILIQIITGPRQVGKTTTAHQLIERWQGPTVYAAADTPLPQSASWIHTHWTAARRESRRGPCLLVLDEVQKVTGWSETVKALWDEDRRVDRPLLPLLLGSSSLLLAKGSSESLAGRFFLHRCTHWSFAECRQAFGWDLDRWLFFGGYPGHYLQLLQTAFLVSGLERHSPGQARSLASSPKLVLWNNGLVSAISTLSFAAARADPSWWGRLVENAVGAHLVNQLQSVAYEVRYWRHRNHEVDFIVLSGDRVWAIEVKSGRRNRSTGLEAFVRKWPTTRALIVGTGGLDLERFLAENPEDLLVD
jgi:predicted AAA+ superfamily ATPase